MVIGVSFHRVVSGAEEAYRRGVTMQKGRTADRPYLTVAEEAADGDVAEVLPEDAGVEVGPSVEVFAAPEAGEEEGAGDLVFAGQGALVVG